MKPVIVRLHASCFGAAGWGVAYAPGIPCARFVAWADAVEFALSLRWRRLTP